MGKFSLLALLTLLAAPLFAGQTDIYNGKMYGIFKPLNTIATPKTITVTGGTFEYIIDRLARL
jgi:hypothetical protein